MRSSPGPVGKAAVGMADVRECSATADRMIAGDLRQLAGLLACDR